MKPIVIAMSVLLAGCTQAAPEPTSQQLAPDLDLNAEEIAAIDRVRAACPGLSRYFPDVEIKAVAIPGYSSDATIEFKVAEDPQRELWQFRAAGHMCFVDIKSGAVSTSKRPCVSTCLQREYDGPADPYELM